MQDLGMKVVALNMRVGKLERKLGLAPITFQQRFSSGYENLLVNRVAQLNTRVVRLERTLGTDVGNRGESTAMLKNIAMKINNLCQRIIRLEKLF